MFWQQIISGISAGSVYSLLAVALVLIYKTTKVVNFAQGEMAMFTTFIAYTFLSYFGFGYFLSIFLTLVISIVFGIAFEILLIRPLRNAPSFNSIIVTIGMFLILNNLAGLLWGREPYSFPAPVAEEPLTLFGLVISRLHLSIILIATLVMLALFFFLKVSKEGVAMRAAVQNMKAALLMGISNNRVSALSWIIGTLIGSVAGLLAAPVLFLDYNMMFMMILKAFAASVFGGLDSLPGAIIGGIILGVSENLIAGYIDPSLKDSLGFLLIVAILLIRPEGLFGRAMKKKV